MRRFGVTYNKAKREEEEAIAAFSKAVIVWSMVLELSPFCCESMPPLLNVWAWHGRGEPIRTPQKKHPINNKRGILVKKESICLSSVSYFGFLMIFLSQFIIVDEIVAPRLRLNLFLDLYKRHVIPILCGDNSFFVIDDS